MLLNSTTEKQYRSRTTNYLDCCRLPGGNARNDPDSLRLKRYPITLRRFSRSSIVGTINNRVNEYSFEDKTGEKVIGRLSIECNTVTCNRDKKCILYYSRVFTLSCGKVVIIMLSKAPRRYLYSLQNGASLWMKDLSFYRSYNIIYNTHLSLFSFVEEADCLSCDNTK